MRQIPSREALARYLLAIAFVLAASVGQARAQPLGYYDPPYPPPGSYLPPGSYPPPAYGILPGYYPPPGFYPPPAYGYAPPVTIYPAPPVVEWVPPRPSSCGRYRYWRGEYCADARYEHPYLGPRW
jgi:hypothetical protein